jgi:hypothetical protein
MSLTRILERWGIESELTHDQAALLGHEDANTGQQTGQQHISANDHGMLAVLGEQSRRPASRSSSPSPSFAPGSSPWSSNSSGPGRSWRRPRVRSNRVGPRCASWLTGGARSSSACAGCRCGSTSP